MSDRYKNGVGMQMYQEEGEEQGSSGFKVQNSL